MAALLILNFIIPFVMLVVGFVLKMRPQPWPGPGSGIKWKLDGSGYNTPLARRSKAHWDFAQITAPGFFIRYGKLALGAAAGCCVCALFLPWYVSLIMGYVLGFACIIEAFVETEKTIQDHIAS